MERGFEQFFVLAAILLAALVDLFVRRLKKKAGKDQPADVEEEAVLVEEEAMLVEEDDSKLHAPEMEEPQLAPARLPSPRPSPPPAVGMPRRRQRARRWLTHPADARLGIVLMAVLGPCRGLETPRSDA